jgi:putative ABC transport system permease protein
MARALEHARGQAGVVDAALASSLPIGMQMPGAYATPFPPPSGGVRAMIVTGTPGMFQTFGVPIVLGRGFDDRDELGAQRVGIVSESLARSLFDTRDAVGRSLFLQSQPTGRRATPPTDVIVIVGIARDTPRETETLPGQHVAQGLLYLPFAQHYESMVAVVARTAGDPAPLVDVLRRAIVSADPEAGVFDAGTGVALSGAQNLVPKIAASISGLLGVLALVLSMAGLYGVLSSVVAGRTREIGVRLALGAEPIRIVRMVLRQGLRPVASGLVAGLAIGVIARVSLRPVFSRIFPALDWQVIAAVPVPFIMAALVACYLPARRAARIDPNVALRDL